MGDDRSCDVGQRIRGEHHDGLDRIHLGRHIERVERAQRICRECFVGLLERNADERLIECDYGDWTGRALKELVRDPLWKLVQTQPSAVRFPSGEALPEVAARAVQAVRDWDARLGADALWVACSHGDVIKAVLADALGLHLDQFQRIVVDPCSTSIVRYTDSRPYVMRVNDMGSDLTPYVPLKSRRRKRQDATPGGGSGPGTT